MSTRKEIKKQINGMALGLISDAFTFMKLHPGKQKEKVMKIVENITQLRNEMIYKVNHPAEKPEKKSLRQYYRDISEEMEKKIDRLSQDLSKLVASK